MSGLTDAQAAMLMASARSGGLSFWCSDEDRLEMRADAVELWQRGLVRLFAPSATWRVEATAAGLRLLGRNPEPPRLVQ